MYFESVEALVQMDGHGIYVWPAYLVTVLGIGFLLWRPLQRKRQLLRSLAAQARRRDAAGIQEEAQ